MFVEVPAERVEKVYVSETFYNKKKEEINFSNYKMEILSDTVFQYVSDTKTPQGILCVVKYFNLGTIEPGEHTFSIFDIISYILPHFLSNTLPLVAESDHWCSNDQIALASPRT